MQWRLVRYSRDESVRLAVVLAGEYRLELDT